MNSILSYIETRRAVIFDLYHTLTATEITSPHGLSSSTILGIDKKVWNEQLMEKSRDRLTGKITDAYEILRSVAHAIDRTIPEELIRQATEHRMKRFFESLEKMPQESVDTIMRLKQIGKKVALLSNADVIETLGWKNCPAAPYFDVVVFSCEAGYMKPDPEIYTLCLKKLGEKVADCTFVGDGGSNEFIGAKSVGLSTIMITGIANRLWPEKLPAIKSNADFVLENVSELVAE